MIEIQSKIRVILQFLFPILLHKFSSIIIFNYFCFSSLFLFACQHSDSRQIENQFHIQNTKEIITLHGNWRVTTNPDFNPRTHEPKDEFVIGYIPRMWFNSEIKNKYIVSYNADINFSDESLQNKFGVLVFNAINSNETYINGKLIGIKGIIDKDKYKIQNNASPSLYPIPNGYLQKGKNQITIRVADNAASGGFLEAPRICEIRLCEKSFNRFLLITGGTGLFMLFIGFYHLLIFLGNRRDKATLYFGAGTIFHALTFLGYERIIYFFSDRFPVHFYTMNLSYCFSCILAVLFIHSFLEKKLGMISKILLLCFGLSIVSTIVAGISIDYRSIHSRQVQLLNIMCLVPILSVQVLYLTFKAYKEKKVGSNLILLGFLLFMITNLLIPLHLLRIIPTKAFTLEGSLVLITCFTFALSRRTKQTSEKLLELEKKYRSELEKEVKDKTKTLELFNEELNKTNKLKSKLFSILAHDLRNPLFALEEVISLFKDEHLTQEALKKNIVSLGNNLENNRFLLENLLRWSYIQLGYTSLILEKVEIRKLVIESIQLHQTFAEKKKILIKITQKKPFHYKADEGIIRLILRNLISNAIKFTNKKGTIEISYGIKNSVAFISVKDNGIGISSGKLKGFSQALRMEKNIRGTEGETGSGIGLNLCKDFAERMNGEIIIKSKEKQGSEFILVWTDNES
jgi:signal transduction histidine kinase